MFPLSSCIETELSEINDELKRAVDTRVELIKGPLQDMINSGGKRLRPIMVITSAHFGSQYDFDKVKPLAVAVELIHMATLVHDDIIDDSPIRRGIPSLQSQLGKDVAVFTGDYIFCKVFDLLASTDNYHLLQYASKALYKICEGEIIQREELFDTHISLKNYLYRIHRKTAILFSLSCQMGAAATEASSGILRTLKFYGTKVGVAFQMVDDLLDMKGDEKELGKPPGTDIREGVITLPAIYALKHSRQKCELRRILQQPPSTQEDVERAIDIIQASGGMEYTEQIAIRYIDKAKTAIAQLPNNPMKDILLNVADYIYCRES